MRDVAISTNVYEDPIDTHEILVSVEYLTINMNKLLACTLVLALLNSVAAQTDYTQFIKDLNSTLTNPRLTYYHYAYDQLAQLVDTIGPRMWGSNNLERAIEHMRNLSLIEKFDVVRLQPVRNFTKWVRGKESLTLLSPRPIPTKLELTALGYSVAGDVTGEVIVVSSWSQLDKRKNDVVGKIVCFNHPWENYTVGTDYRRNGASRAAKYGAIAMLVRSVTPSSIGSVHTGNMQYDPDIGKIPAAAITIQDADMFQRMQARGQKIIVHLVTHSQFVGGCNSSNLIVEITGSTYPDQIILAGGHIDSWDTGSQTGANDDGGGFMTVFSALRLLKGMGYRPKRTIRFIAWSGEESGRPDKGAFQYLETHRSQLSKHIVAFESDLGSTQLTGFGHTGVGESIIKGILKDYMSMIGAGTYDANGRSTDVEPLYTEGGVPMLRNLPKDTQNSDFYFRYHHSAGDSMSIMNPDEMDSNVLGIAGMLYILADLDKTLRDVPTDHLIKLIA